MTDELNVHQTPAPVSLPGVVVQHQPTITIAASIQNAVRATLGTLPDDAKGAILGVATPRGVNLAFAYKLESGWDVAAWVGKSGWDGPLDGGILVQKIIR